MSAEAAPVELLAATIAAARREAPGRPLIVGIAGAQGSGKSTLAANLVSRFPGAATLSLDDLYLTKAERARLAREVHPLFATRGVPGTHDLALGSAILDAFLRGTAARLPRFDKGRDERAPEGDWPLLPQGCDLLVWEGWCLGAPPQTDEALAEPVNAREREEDPQGIWRGCVNAQLAGPYRALFERMDLIAYLQAPSFETVFAWRRQQEEALRAARPDAPGLMDEAALRRFVALYERLTRHMIAVMPSRADLTLALDAERRCRSVTRRG